jgi:autotransporter translocation and assembly factor TamB
MDWQGPLTLGTWEPAWSVHASPAVLDQVAGLVNHWTGSTVLPDWVAGTADIDVTLSGPWNQLAVGVRLDAQPLLLPPITLDRVVAEGDIRGSELKLGQTRFTIGDGQGAVGGALNWGPESGAEQLDLDIQGHRIPLARVADWIGVVGQTSGALSFTGGLRGPLASPRGSWAVGVDDAVVLGQPVGDGSASVDLAEARFNARGIDFDLGLNGSIWWEIVSGTIGGALRWAGMPLTLFGDAVIQLAGDVADVDLQFELPREGHVSGHLEASSTAAQLTAHAEPDTVTIDANLADAATTTATLHRSAAGSLEGSGDLRLESATRLVSRTSPDSQIPLSGDAHATFDVRWPAGEWPRITGEVLELGLTLDQRPVRLLEPAGFSISEEGFEVEDHRLRVADDELHARWMILPDGGLRGELSGSTDALLLRFLLPEWEPAGRANGEVNISGTVTRPLFEGITELSQASFRIPGTRNILSGINGSVLLSSDEFFLEGVDFRFMQGLGKCGGVVRLSDDTVSLGLNGTIDDLRYEMFPGLVAYLSGTWQLNGPSDNLDLSGDITVDRASLRRKDDVTALLLDWFSDSSAVPGVGGMRLDLHVEADQTIDISNPFLRLVGSASIDIGGTTSQPGIVGNIDFEEGGEVTLQTVRYEIERGTLTFSDPSSNQPFIELQARTWIQNYDITVRLTGTTDRLVPSVASNPPLPEDEIYSLLGVGYRDQRLGRGAMGVAFASSMITRELTAELERRTNLILPIDQVRVDPFTESSTGNPTARVSVIKQLHPTWTFMLQSNLSGAGETVVVSRWYLAPGLFIEGSRDIDSSYGVDLKLRRPY